MAICQIAQYQVNSRAADALSKVTTYYPAHRARLDEFHGRGVLLMAYPLGKTPEGAMAVFTTREAAG